jgi:deoxyribodipyrimidine photo-lyase
MNKERIHRLTKKTYKIGPILYWMDREMRAHDNWALVHALALGKKYDQPVGIIYNLVSDYLGGGKRQYEFKLGGLKELEETCEAKGIPFTVLLTDKSGKDIIKFIKKLKVGYLVTDFNPLRINQTWKKKVAQEVRISFDEVDAHNIVPVWVTSRKEEYAARTIRPKIHKHLDEFLDDFPVLRKRKQNWKSFPKTDWKALKSAKVDESVIPVDWAEPGEKAARNILRSFIDKRLKGYDEKRNDPNEDHLSKLSPYFHYGMLAPQRAILEVDAAKAPRKDRDAYIEEAVIRRELSDNYCYYNKNYDSFGGFPKWAQKSLKKHRNDKRDYIYTKKQFEKAETHDSLWNAAQKQMVQTGKMHGYMRMYWAKKILEWTNTPEYAQEIAIYLNDKYELDGRDPNGYVGIAWSIGGVHDRAWPERKVFGKVRYMNAKGCARKFDTEKYIQVWTQEKLI